MGLTLERKHGRGRDLARGAEKNIAGLFFETHENMSDSVVTSSPQVMNDVCSFCQTGVADVNILTVSCAFIYAYLELLRM